MILCPNEIITGDDLPRGFKSSLDNALHIDGIPANAKLYETLEMVEKTMIQRALKMADNVQSHAAAILGIGKSGLNQKIKKYNLEVGAKS
jgi:two-component system NtrC family response regulator